MDHKEHYTRQSLLGEGGMGKVYLATDNQLQRQVAIKELTYQAEDSDNNSALNEARLLARVSHANIIQIYNVHDENDYISLVMEYFKSKSLTQFQQEHYCTLTQKIDLLQQLSAGLAAAHKNNVIHCDLKPTNILVDAQGLLKITDFGIALLATNDANASDNIMHAQVSDTTDTQLYGSLLYMSPEQIQGKTLDYRSDIFSLGIVAYQLMVGSHPFGRSSATDIGERICKITPEHAKNLMLNAPLALTDLLMEMLITDVEQRSLTASAIENRLQHIKNALMRAEISEQETVALGEQLLGSNSLLDSSRELPSSATATTQAFHVTSHYVTTQVVDPMNKLTTPWYQKTYAIVAAIVLLSFSVFYILGALNANTVSNKQVVILKPNVTDSPLMAPIQQELVVSAVEDALRQAVINTQNMYLISQREVNAVLKDYPDDVAKLKQAAGASDIISTNLVCDNNRCKVSFTRLVAKENQADKLLVKSERNWLVPIDKFNVIFSTSQTQFASLFPEQAEVNQSGLVQRPINEQDYRQYIELYSKIKGQGDHGQDSLKELEVLLSRSPYLYAAYGLYRQTASNLYVDTRDNSYLEQLQRILQQSPPEYRYSVYHAIDSFWLACYLDDMQLASQYILEAKSRGLDSLTEIELYAYFNFINGKYQQAVDAYKQTLVLRQSTRLLYNLALASWRIGDIEGAQAALEKILNMIPNHYLAQRLQANIWLRQGELNLAISAYTKIVAEVNNTNDLTNLSLAYALNNQYELSLTFAKKALEKSPEHPFYLLNLADIEMILGNTESAKAYYKRVIEILIGKNEVKYLTNLAQAYAHLQQADLAISAINQAQALAPNNGEVSYASAIVYSLLGENVSAIYHMKLALQDSMGLVWFNLPWFDLLCINTDFIDLMSEGDNLERCSTIE